MQTRPQSLSLPLSLSLRIYIYIYIYMCVCVCVCVCVTKYIYVFVYMLIHKQICTHYRWCWKTISMILIFSYNIRIILNNRVTL